VEARAAGIPGQFSVHGRHLAGGVHLQGKRPVRAGKETDHVRPRRGQDVVDGVARGDDALAA
jgi:hypothetical protein